MRPADSKTAPMRPSSQFEFATHDLKQQFFLCRGHCLRLVNVHLIWRVGLHWSEVQREADKPLGQMVSCVSNVCGFGGIKGFHFGCFSEGNNSRTTNEQCQSRFYWNLIERISKSDFIFIAIHIRP